MGLAIYGIISVLDIRKPVFLGLQTIKVQTSLCIPTVWSAPLLFAYWKGCYLDLLRAKFQFFIATLCSCAGLFEYHFVGNPEDRFCCIKAHFIVISN